MIYKPASTLEKPVEDIKPPRSKPEETEAIQNAEQEYINSLWNFATYLANNTVIKDKDQSLLDAAIEELGNYINPDLRSKYSRRLPEHSKIVGGEKQPEQFEKRFEDSIYNPTSLQGLKEALFEVGMDAKVGKKGRLDDFKDRTLNVKNAELQYLATIENLDVRKLGMTGEEYKRAIQLGLEQKRFQPYMIQHDKKQREGDSSEDIVDDEEPMVLDLPSYEETEILDDEEPMVLDLPSYEEIEKYTDQRDQAVKEIERLERLQKVQKDLAKRGLSKSQLADKTEKLRRSTRETKEPDRFTYAKKGGGIVRGRGLYFPAGENHYIDMNKLDKGYINVKNKNFKQVGKMEIAGGTLCSAVKSVLKGKNPRAEDVEELNDRERGYLNKLAKLTGEGNFHVPVKNLSEEEKEQHQFDVMKGEIIAGNDNEQLVKDFKRLLIKLMAKHKINKKEGHDILMELVILGY